ncbi:MAG: lipid III flippase WzxE [Arsenophonus sp.]
MSLYKLDIWILISTLIKISTGLIIIKLIAVSFGPSGVGQIGNFRQFITILGVLSGAGIYNGVIKYVSEYYHTPEKLSDILGSALSIILSFSTLLLIIFLFFSSLISFALFGHDQYKIVIYALALIQIGIASANYFLSILKGFNDVRGISLSLIIGNLIGVIAYFFYFRLSSYQVALIGLALIPALILVPASIIVIRHKKLNWSYFKPRWNIFIVYNLSKFTLMALITSVALPFAYIVIRNLLANRYGWYEVGILQAVSGVSDAYLQFITAYFTVYLLPTLSKLKNRNEISLEILKTLKFILPVTAISSFIVWFLRDAAIFLFFSDKFMATRDLFIWQLIGDVLKIGSYIFGYLVIAKMALQFYILTETTQFALLTGFSYWLIPSFGVLGAVQAYMVTYIIYFIICSGIFYIYSRGI